MKWNSIGADPDTVFWIGNIDNGIKKISVPLVQCEQLSRGCYRVFIPKSNISCSHKTCTWMWVHRMKYIPNLRSPITITLSDTTWNFMERTMKFTGKDLCHLSMPCWSSYHHASLWQVEVKVHHRNIPCNWRQIICHLIPVKSVSNITTGSRKGSLSTTIGATDYLLINESNSGWNQCRLAEFPRVEAPSNLPFKKSIMSTLWAARFSLCCYVSPTSLTQSPTFYCLHHCCCSHLCYLNLMNQKLHKYICNSPSLFRQTSRV